MSFEKQASSARVRAFLKKVKSVDLGPIARKLMGYGWTGQQTNYAIARYMMFMSLVYTYPEQLLVPTPEVDQVWHCHLLHTSKYRQDCGILFGQFIDHEPDSEIEAEINQQDLDAAFAQTQALFEQHFGKAALEDVNLPQVQQQNNSGKRSRGSACGRPKPKNV